jgi:predicted PurR-regulated permease PerM
MSDPIPSRPANAPEPPPIPTAPALVESDVENAPVHVRERRRRQVGWRSKDIIRTAALVLAMYIVAQLVWVANPLFLIAFLGTLFGLAIGAGVDRLERFSIRRGAGAAMIVITFFGLLVAFGFWMAPTLRDQSAELRRKLPESIDRLELWLNKRPGLLGIVLHNQTPSATGGGAAQRARPDSAQAAQPVTQPVAPTAVADSQATTLRQRITQQVSGATKYLFPFLSSTVAGVAGMLLIVFLSIYIAADPDLYHRGLMHLFPHAARKRAGEVLSAIAIVLRKWLVTQLIAMAVIGVVSTTVLLLLNVKAAFALGLLAGLFEFVPTVGPILSAVPAVAMGFLDSPEKALYVAIAYILIQFAENHLLIPLLMKGGIDVPPVVTILSQALMALLFGFLGLMTAVPLAAAVLVTVKLLYVEGVVGDAVAVTNVDARKDRHIAPFHRA